ncbi:MAG: hypothetical protein ACK41T_03700 [Pseudobdellovibrio sp.]
MKIEILLKPTSEFGTLNNIAIHSLNPSYDKILQLIAEAEKDNFTQIVVYSDINFSSRTNIHNGMSTWSRLIRDLDADVRAGMIERKYGQVLGQGFTIYL